MARSDEADAFFYAVYRAVQQIPPGRVTSYGHIARLIGTPQRPRQVGVCLKHLPTNPSLRFHHDNVPWQRVISSKAIVSPRSNPEGTRAQADVLRSENVEVTTGPLGELKVDFAQYGWFPGALPEDSMGRTAAERSSRRRRKTARRREEGRTGGGEGQEVAEGG